MVSDHERGGLFNGEYIPPPYTVSRVESIIFINGRRSIPGWFGLHQRRLPDPVPDAGRSCRQQLRKKRQTLTVIISSMSQINVNTSLLDLDETKESN